MKNHSTSAVITLVACCALVVSMGFGCGASRPNTVSEETAPSSNTKVTADAYLFDTQVTVDGRLTSLRLEIFDADSVIGLSGRAYLGKGALKGRITADSVLLYFPSSNQYIARTTEGILHTDSCSVQMSTSDLLRILHQRPPSAVSSTPGKFGVVSETADNAEMIATWCRKVFDLKYYRTAEEWHLGGFNFNDSLGTEIRALRREMRPGAKIKSSQFHVTIPADAERIVR